jgi:hypothetical protein
MVTLTVISKAINNEVKQFDPDQSLLKSERILDKFDKEESLDLSMNLNIQPSISTNQDSENKKSEVKSDEK